MSPANVLNSMLVYQSLVGIGAPGRPVDPLVLLVEGNVETSLGGLIAASGTSEA